MNRNILYTYSNLTEFNQLFAELQQQDKVILDVNFAQVFASPSEQSQIVCDAVLGCVFKKTSYTKDWQGVETPDGRSGFVKKR